MRGTGKRRVCVCRTRVRGSGSGRRRLGARPALGGVVEPWRRPRAGGACGAPPGRVPGGRVGPAEPRPGPCRRRARRPRAVLVLGDKVRVIKLRKPLRGDGRRAAGVLPRAAAAVQAHQQAAARLLFFLLLLLTARRRARPLQAGGQRRARHSGATVTDAWRSPQRRPACIPTAAESQHKRTRSLVRPRAPSSTSPTAAAAGNRAGSAAAPARGRAPGGRRRPPRAPPGRAPRRPHHRLRRPARRHRPRARAWRRPRARRPRARRAAPGSSGTRPPAPPRSRARTACVPRHAPACPDPNIPQLAHATSNQ